MPKIYTKRPIIQNKENNICIPFKAVGPKILQTNKC